MNFFGLGWGELMAIAVLALIVVGPKQLPLLLKQMGVWFAKAQQMQRELRRGVDDIVRDTELDEITRTINQTRNFTPVGAAERLLTGKEQNPTRSNQDESTDGSGNDVKNPDDLRDQKATKKFDAGAEQSRVQTDRVKSLETPNDDAVVSGSAAEGSKPAQKKRVSRK